MQKLFWATGVCVTVVACAAGESSDLEGTVAQPASNQLVARDAGRRTPIQDAPSNVDSALQPVFEDAGVEVDADADVFAEDASAADAAWEAGRDAGRDGGTDAGRDAGRDGGADAGRDSGTPADTGAATGPCAGVLINEIQTWGRAGAADEFVEIFNPGASCGPVTMDLVYRAATGSRDVALGTWNISMVSGSYLVFSGTSFTGVSSAPLSSGLAADGGQLQLRTAAGVVLDSVGYGTARGAYVRGTPAPAQPTNGSVGRHAGVDTGNNGADFSALGTPTPGAANP